MSKETLDDRLKKLLKNTKDLLVLLKLIGFIWLGYLTVVVTTFSIHKGLKELEKKNLQQTKK